MEEAALVRRGLVGADDLVPGWCSGRGSREARGSHHPRRGVAGCAGGGSIRSVEPWKRNPCKSAVQQWIFKESR